jgi:diguanylate cyclase (GGDEF)-like protein
LSLWSEGEFLRHDRKATLFFGLIYGGIAAMVLSNLFLFVTLRARVHILYSLHLMLYATLSLAAHGYGFMWLWPNHPGINDWIFSDLICFMHITGLLFATTFLNTRQYPRLHRLSRILIAVYSILTVLVWFDRYFDRLIPSPPLILPYILFMLWIGIHAWYNGNRSARFFLLGTFFSLVGGVVSTLTNDGLLPYSFTGFYAFEMGICLDAILLSFAIADRMRQMELERAHAIHLAETDPLTGLFNRRGFEEYAARELSRAARHGRPLAVAILDIDHFKRVNDCHSHAGGDVVLREVAECLHQGARVSDVVGRWGGEEFILLLPETTLAEAGQLAERLRLQIAGRLIAFAGQEIHCTASFGIAGLAPGEPLESLIHRADTLLYRAKEQGRNRCLVEATAGPHAAAAAPVLP